MKTDVFCFSGTGNSPFIAEKLQEGLDNSELIPVIRAGNDGAGRISAEKVVLVFPVYALTVPIPVRDFLDTHDFIGGVRDRIVSSVIPKLMTFSRFVGGVYYSTIAESDQDCEGEC